MTTAELIDWPEDPTGQLWQLVDGEPQAMAPASDTHGSIQAEIARRIGNHLFEMTSECRVVAAPGIVPRVQADMNVRVPDLAVTCNPNDPRERLLQGPVLIIEVLSPSNERETWANVWAYTTIPSVQEILVVHSLKIGAELLVRNSDGTWPERPSSFGANDSITLASIKGAFRLADFYVTTALGHLGGSERSQV